MAQTRVDPKIEAAHKLTAAGLRHFEVGAIRHEDGDELVGIVLRTAIYKDPRKLAVARLRRGRLIGLKVDV